MPKSQLERVVQVLLGSLLASGIALLVHGRLTLGVDDVRVNDRSLAEFALIWFFGALVVEAAAATTADRRAGVAFLRCGWAIVGAGLGGWLARQWYEGLTLPTQYEGALIVVFATFFVATALTPTLARSSLGDLSAALAFTVSKRVFAVFVFSVVVLVAGLPMLAEPRPAEGPMGAEFVEWFSSRQRAPLPSSLTTTVVTVLEFTDYQCKPCRAGRSYYNATREEIEREHPGKLRWLTLDFPMDKECNPTAVDDVRHAAACEAAVAVRLADRVGRAERMQDWLWSHQDELTRQSVLDAARQITGIADVADAYATIIKDVSADVALGRGLGVTRAPTYIINGVAMGFVPARNLKAAIVYEIDSADRRGGRR